ncbi:MAG: DUF3016 domain-containing protein [Aquabacterium sp.]
MSSIQHPLLAIALALLSGATFAASPASVKWNEETWRYADIRSNMGHDEQHLKAIAAHIGELAARSLAPGQTLEVELKDVDLAGEMRWLRRGAQEVRVISGGVDSPMIELRWAIKEGDRTLRGGDSRLTDLGYLTRANRYARSEPLRYEKRMLDEWFSQTVVAR